MILCVGEILVDLIGRHENGEVVYNRYPGGAPFNVACDIQKQDCEVGFVGCVGADLMGDFLLDFANKQQFSFLAVKQHATRNTTLAFVELDSFGERKFSFHREHTADAHISLSDVDAGLAQASIVHVGSLMLNTPEGREVADAVFSKAKACKRYVSFDVNFRDDIFLSKEAAVEIYKKYISSADILKFSEDEVEIFTDSGDIRDVIREDQLVFVTLGERGSRCYYRGRIYCCETIRVTPQDTTGAGDAFYAGVLSRLDRMENFGQLDAQIEGVLRYGNICGALTATAYGATTACPTRQTVESYL